MKDFEKPTLYKNIPTHTTDHTVMNSPAEPNEDHKQVMPQTIEAYKQLAQRDLELIEEQRDEISKLKQQVNKLEQKVNKLRIVK